MMKPPSSSKRITKEWVQYIVNEHLKKSRPSQPTSDVNIKCFTINQGANAGEGFNSELIALDIVASLKGEREVEETQTDVEFHFIVKFFKADVFGKEANIKCKSHLREHAIYAEIIRDLNDFQVSMAGDEFRIHIPELIYGKCSDKEFVLVMENIKAQGYDTNDKYLGLDFGHLKEAVSQIARVHALSYAYNRKNSIMKKYPYFKLFEEVKPVIAAFAGFSIDNSIAILKIRDDTEDLAKKLEASKERLIADVLSSISLNEKVPNCIVHGDYWNSNVMFKVDTKTSSEQIEAKLLCKIIDWGNTGWGSPVIDLQYLIYTSTTVETRREHLESVLQLYHSLFIDITSKLDVLVPDWSYADFQLEWKRLSVVGFIMGLGLVQGTLCKSNPFSKPSEPSLLDHTACLPVKFITDGVKLGMIKALMPIVFKPFAAKFMSSMYKKMLRPITEELLSGTNEVMNKRLLDLLLEAEERGLV